jgi:hypothetical protein
MSSSAKREVSHDPRETKTIQKNSSRLIRKNTDSNSRKYFLSTEAK